jgi:hypothetical protein
MRSLITAVLLGGAAASLGAQATATIDPGMSRDQVVAKLGEPLSVRNYDGHTYLLYKNGCEKTCGMNDLVVLDSGKVVDAVFRAAGRKYSGTSSSPRMISMTEAQHGNGTGPLAMPAGEPKAKPAAKTPAKAESKRTETRAARLPMNAAPKTDAAKNPAPAPVTKKTDVAPAKKTEAAPKKTEPAPKKAEPAPTKTAAPAPPAKKPDAAPTKKTEPSKKPETATKPPTAIE